MGRYTGDNAKEAMLDELDKLRNDGKVSAEVYRQFRGFQTANPTAGG